jgi:hypothetical protein
VGGDCEMRSLVRRLVFLVKKICSTTKSGVVGSSNAADIFFSGVENGRGRFNEASVTNPQSVNVTLLLYTNNR